MAQAIKILIIFTLYLAILLWRNYSFHSSVLCECNDFIGIICPVGQQRISTYPFNQVDSFLAISSGTRRYKYSDRHTIRIHGKVNFGIEPPFVRLMS